MPPVASSQHRAAKTTVIAVIVNSRWKSRIAIPSAVYSQAPPLWARR
jgi:hypothetical protein